MLNTIIFDMDGVIFDTEALSLRCWKRTAQEHHMEDIESLFPQCIGANEARTRVLFAEKYGERFSYDEYAAAASKAFFAYVEQHGMPMKPGVCELLSYLKEKNYKIGLASSTKEALVRSQLEGRGLLGYFQVVVCGDMVKKSKPEPDIFLMACERIGTDPEGAYAIEDSYNGIRSASSAGMKAIMVPDLIAPDDEMKRLAFKILPSLYEVKDFLEKENRNVQ